MTGDPGRFVTDCSRVRGSRLLAPSPNFIACEEIHIRARCVGPLQAYGVRPGRPRAFTRSMLSVRRSPAAQVAGMRRRSRQSEGLCRREDILPRIVNGQDLSLRTQLITRRETTSGGLVTSLWPRVARRRATSRCSRSWMSTNYCTDQMPVTWAVDGWCDALKQV